MREFEGRTAVVTGAASGIGASLARRCAALGMSVALADVDEKGLEALRHALSEEGVRAIAVPTDVSKQAQVAALADAAEAAFGNLHLVFNNAGVLETGLLWEVDDADWQWVLGVNLLGVIHGARVFVPRLLAHGESAHLVNTGSVGGLLVGPSMAPYLVSKHAVVAFTEALHLQVAALEGARLKVSVLCPGGVATGIANSERARPKEFGGGAPLSEEKRAFSKTLGENLKAAMSPDEVAEHTFAAIREERFWILPDPSFRDLLEQRVQGIVNGVNPVYSGRMG